MLTPFHPNGKIDYDGLAGLTEFYLEAGATGLFANCQSSEMYHLDPEERIALIKQVIQIVNGRVPVVAAGTFERSVKNQSEFIKRIHDLGTEAVILITGMLAAQEEADDLLETHVDQLLDTTGDIPLGFYECPEPYKRVLSPALLSRFVKTGRIIYHKDTSLEIDQVRQKIALTSSNEAFGLYDAYMVHAVDSLNAGAAGLSCIQGNFFPELIVWLCKHYDRAEAREQVDQVQQFFIRHMNLMHTAYPKLAKYYLQKKRGLAIDTYCRTPTPDLDSDLEKQVEALHQESVSMYRQLAI